MVIFLLFTYFPSEAPIVKMGVHVQMKRAVVRIFFYTCVFLWSIGTRKYAEPFEFPMKNFLGWSSAQLYNACAIIQLACMLYYICACYEIVLSDFEGGLAIK